MLENCQSSVKKDSFFLFGGGEGQNTFSLNYNERIFSPANRYKYCLWARQGPNIVIPGGENLWLFVPSLLPCIDKRS